ncbi:MAG: hypothetical protein LUQ25_03005 [Methanoregulaceae archaeon]|nr:hypothetical protein [Methanoregulaceae archaeon]
MKTYATNGIPLEAQYLFRSGRELADSGSDERALQKFKQAAMIAPCFSRAYHEAGICLTRLGRSDEAAIFHEKARHLAIRGSRVVTNDEEGRKRNNT